jgi:molecular chaperone Hsp33
MLDDYLSRFLLDDLDILGAVVRLGPAWRKMLENRDYPAPVRRLLGEMSATTLLLGDKLKQPGRLTIQLRGNGPVSLLVIDCNEQLQIRGMARCATQPEEHSVPALLGDGQLLLSLDMPSMREPYQSIVPLDGESIAEVFEHYLGQSEQLPARFFLAASSSAAAGLCCRNCHRRSARRGRLGARRGAGSHGKDPELLSLPAEELLRASFHEETVRLFPRGSSSTTAPRTGKKCVSCCVRSAPLKSMPSCASMAKCSSRTTSAIGSTVSTRRPSTPSSDDALQTTSPTLH